MYQNWNDTLSNWNKNNLFGGSVACKSSFQLDSLLCFNKNRNRVVSTILYGGCRTDQSDLIQTCYGAKIKNKWYFFGGASYTLLRDYYGSDINTPLSFEKMHEIALEEIYSGYLIKKDKGFWGNIFGKTEWEINEAFFEGMESRHTDGSYGSCHGCKTFNEYVIYITNLQWKKPGKDGHIQYNRPTEEEMKR